MHIKRTSDATSHGAYSYQSNSWYRLLLIKITLAYPKSFTCWQKPRVQRANILSHENDPIICCNVISIFHGQVYTLESHKIKLHATYMGSGTSSIRRDSING